MTASFADNEIWHVQLAADDLKRMNVEQLDDAFRLSLVDASTMVWKAGMKSWQRLGAVAGIDEDEEEPEDSVTRMRRAPTALTAPPPPPRPMARPVPKPPSPRSAPQRLPPSLAPAFAAPTSVAPTFAAPLVAPVYTPPLRAPDPYVMPTRRAAIASEVDFRRSSRGVRWGRWLVAVLVVTGGVLGAYRQNLLRAGARQLGLENKYLHGEQRVTAFVSAKAPYAVKNALTSLALLPGPNALRSPEPKPTLRAAEPAVAAAPPSPTPQPPVTHDSDVQTVSLESLPVLSNEPAAERALAGAAPGAKAETRNVETPRTEPRKAETPKSEARKAEPVGRKHSVKVSQAEKAEPVAKPKAKAEPVAKPKAAPPAPSPGNDNPLKAAIRSAIAADAAK